MNLARAAFEAVAAALPPCLIKTFTGIPCPTCGATRALRHLLHGDLVAAIATNPGVVAALAGMPLLAAWALRTPPGAWPAPARRAGLAAVAFAAAANWAYVVAVGI